LGVLKTIKKKQTPPLFLKKYLPLPLPLPLPFFYFSQLQIIYKALLIICNREKVKKISSANQKRKKFLKKNKKPPEKKEGEGWGRREVRGVLF